LPAAPPVPVTGAGYGALPYVSRRLRIFGRPRRLLPPSAATTQALTATGAAQATGRATIAGTAALTATGKALAAGRAAISGTVGLLATGKAIATARTTVAGAACFPAAVAVLFDVGPGAAVAGPDLDALT
jgi:hypothetical protein